MNYTKETIKQLGDCIDGKTGAFNQLVNAGFKELGMLNEALTGKEEAFKWLMDNKHYIISAVANAIYNDDLKAIEFLVKMKAPQWAAVAGTANGSKQAEHWLKTHKMEEYSQLAQKIRNKIKRESGSDFEVIFRSPIS